jgi:gamma-D-glutamyl-L-lysine dipeptidyl-peptidase
MLLTGSGCAFTGTGITKLGYSIQVGAFSEVKNAERLTNRLHAQGIEAFYFKRDNGLFAVRFGDFPSKREADRAARKVVAEQGLAGYFVAPPLQIPLVAASKSPDPEKTEPKPHRTPDREDMGYIAARTAERFVGIPYQWGGNNVVDGMDCSGFVRAVYNLCGVNIPRTSGEQFRVGKNVSRGDLVDGDLVFFGYSESSISHVGIFVGNNRFVHAPKRGEDIKISSLDSGYSRKFIGARRYF